MAVKVNPIASAALLFACLLGCEFKADEEESGAKILLINTLNKELEGQYITVSGFLNAPKSYAPGTYLLSHSLGTFDQDDNEILVVNLSRNVRKESDNLNVGKFCLITGQLEFPDKRDQKSISDVPILYNSDFLSCTNK